MAASLRLINESDLERVMHWRMLPDITRYMYTDPILNIEQQHDWYSKIATSQSDIVWNIELDGVGPVGLLSLGDIDRVNRRCVWAYYLAEEAARGKGLAKPLECNIADFVFGPLGMSKLWCEVFSINDRVIKLHERFGSRVEGLLREHIRKGTDIFDVVRMGLLKADWEIVKTEVQYDTLQIEIPRHFIEFGGGS